MISPKDQPKKRPPKDSMTLLPCFYFVELPIVASSMASLYFLELTDVLRPAQAGFHCRDRALSMPYVQGSEELLPPLLLLSLAFAGPAAAIMLGEGLLYCLQSWLKLRPRSEVNINAGGCNFNSFLRRTVRFVGVQIFGLLATALVTDVMQLATGYHTPFYLTVCQPNYTLPGVSCERNSYITRDICSGPDLHAILAARKSFPSQHATLSAFAAVYISMYFNSTLSDSTRLLKPVLVFGFCMAAVLAGLTQVTQHHSHPTDVYAGFLIGAAIAAYLALYSVGNFQSPAPPPQPPPPPPPPAREDALRTLLQRGHASVYHKGGACGSGEEPRRGAEPRRQARREKVSSADVELLAPRGSMGKETMVTFSNTLPRVGCPDNARRPLTFLAPPLGPLASEWKQRSLEFWGAGPGEEPELDREGVGERSATPSPLYPGRGGGVAMATVSTPPRAVAPPLLHIPEEAGAPPLSPVPHGAAATPGRSEQGGAAGSVLTLGGASGSVLTVGGAAGATPGPFRPPTQPRVAQVIAMSSPRPSDTPSSSSCASSTCSSESACGHAPHRILTINAHAPHHPLVPGPAPPSPANGAPWPHLRQLGPARSLSPAQEPPEAPPPCVGIGQRALSVERAGLTERALLGGIPPPQSALRGSLPHNQH
ncbi:phospholipid phosphatase-related protein type 3-like [Conger conger]|uniref:phospholipid phosphatase-related protein type 3-like n=1 Tax=Conger conger TaxID=82655 RepID=UPI002A5A2854|nr:phospholipid phosphatase-related protein type 3-like [Conger conger]